MNRREFWALQGVSGDELEASLSGLLGAGARVEARIVAHLAEVEARRLHLLAGYSSLYDYCRKRLGLSDYEAFIRIAAARVARKYPVVFEMLERRELHLSAIYEVREFLTTENHRELLGAVSRKTKLQVREILAQQFPQADVPASLKKREPWLAKRLGAETDEVACSAAARPTRPGSATKVSAIQAAGWQPQDAMNLVVTWPRCVVVSRRGRR